MKLGKPVGIVLLLALVVYSAIVLFGTQTPLFTGILFFIIISSLAAIVIILTWSSTKEDIIFIIFQLFFISIICSLLLSGGKLYYLENEKNKLLLEDISYEIDALSATNDQYSGIINGLDDELSMYRIANDELSIKIDRERSILNGTSPAEEVVNIDFLDEAIYYPIIEDDYLYEEYYEYEDDDDEEEDEEDDD